MFEVGWFSDTGALADFSGGFILTTTEVRYNPLNRLTKRQLRLAL